MADAPAGAAAGSADAGTTVKAHAVPAEGGLALCGQDCHTVTDASWPPYQHPDVCDECLDLVTLS